MTSLLCNAANARLPCSRCEATKQVLSLPDVLCDLILAYVHSWMEAEVKQQFLVWQEEMDWLGTCGNQLVRSGFITAVRLRFRHILEGIDKLVSRCFIPLPQLRKCISLEACFFSENEVCWFFAVLAEVDMHYLSPHRKAPIENHMLQSHIKKQIQHLFKKLK